jgi:hypothetical protein
MEAIEKEKPILDLIAPIIDVSQNLIGRAARK